MSWAIQLEQRFAAGRTTRFGELNLADEFIPPHYYGHSITNLAASIATLLGGRHPTPPLDAVYLEGLTHKVRRVVLVIVDGLSYALLQRALADQPDNGFQRLLAGGGRLGPLTSVFPSTTTAALTSLWCGYAPAQHGLVGFQLFLRQPGVRANMITFTPTALRGSATEALIHTGPELEKFLPVPALPQTLSAASVPTYNFIEQRYEKSPLSRVQIRGVRETFGIVNATDLWIGLRHGLERSTKDKALFVGYWSALDTINHTYGPGHEAAAAEVHHFAAAFEREFLNKLSPAITTGTLFLLTADHGHLDTPLAHTVYLPKHPEVTDRLTLNMTGEPRAAYLYCQQGEMPAVREYFAEQLAAQFQVLDSRAALEGGLFGPTPFAAETRPRLGDLLVLARGNYSLYDGKSPPKSKGRHGSLTASEMLVPLLAARLD